MDKIQNSPKYHSDVTHPCQENRAIFNLLDGQMSNAPIHYLKSETLVGRCSLSTRKSPNNHMRPDYFRLCPMRPVSRWAWTTSTPGSPTASPSTETTHTAGRWSYHFLYHFWEIIFFHRMPKGNTFFLFLEKSLFSQNAVRHNLSLHNMFQKVRLVLVGPFVLMFAKFFKILVIFSIFSNSVKCCIFLVKFPQFG